MTIDANIREQVRQRAGCAYEFCGINEKDTGGYLTVDHFQPKSKGGQDNLDNLIYRCTHCNQYKLDYWPEKSNDPALWNPRLEPATLHFSELDNGTLLPLSKKGEFTIRRLRLNRSPLIAYRLNKNKVNHYHHLLNHYQELTQSLERLLQQLAELMDEQQQLLKKQSEILQYLMSLKK